MRGVKGGGPAAEIFVGHGPCFVYADGVAGAEHVGAARSGDFGDFVGVGGAEVMELFFSCAAVFGVEAHKDFFVLREEIGVLPRESAVVSVEIKAVACADSLAIQADNHEFAVDPDALIGFRFGARIAF